MAEQLQHALPFMVAATNGKGPTLNTARIFEQLLLAAVLAGGAWLFLVPKLELQTQYMQKEMGEISADLKALRRDVEKLKLDAAVDRARHGKD